MRFYECKNDVESQINFNYFRRMDHFDHSYAKKTFTELMQDGIKAQLFKRGKVQFLSYSSPLHNSMLLREDSLCHVIYSCQIFGSTYVVRPIRPWLV